MRFVIVSIDGTGCSLTTGTNIGQIHNLAQASGLTRIYKPGPGAISNTKIRDKLFSPNSEPMAASIYQDLVDLDLKYDDHIYIFGYSRGAVIARTLASCISNPESVRKIDRMAVAYGSIPAQIHMLCLFDPVTGRPRFRKARVRSHEAVYEQKIRHYLELLALSDVRPMFPSDSYTASPEVKKRLRQSSSAREVKTTGDRKQIIRELQLRKTRRCVWFPGTHGDVGGHGKNSHLGYHALATALDYSIQASTEYGSPLPLSADKCREITLTLNKPEEVRREKGKAKLFSRMAFHLKKYIQKHINNRAPCQDIIVQHLAHFTCKSGEDVDVNIDLPFYEGYPHLNRLSCTKRMRDSSRESGVVSGMHEQTGTPDL